MLAACAVTIHDCTFFDHPEWHLRTKAAFFRRAIRRAAQRAAVLICVSRVTAERLGAHCPVRAPVVVAPHGVDHARFTPAEKKTKAIRTDMAVAKTIARNSVVTNHANSRSRGGASLPVAVTSWPGNNSAHRANGASNTTRPVVGTGRPFTCAATTSASTTTERAPAC